MKRANFILLLIFSVGLLFRLYKVTIPLLEFYPTRQVQTAEITKNLFNRGFNILKPEVGYLGPEYAPFLFEFPGYNFIVASIYLITGVNEIVGRLFSIIGWTIASIFLYKIAKLFINETAAVVAVFFYTFSPLSILISRSFQPDQWMLTTSLISIYFILKWARVKNFFFFFLSAIFLSLSVLLKMPSLVFTFPMIFGSFFIRRKIREFLIYVLLVLAPSISWYLYGFLMKGSSGAAQGGFSIANWFGFEVFLNPKYYSNIFGFEYNLVLLPVGIILFLMGLATKLKKNQRFLYFWFAGTTLYFIFFNKHIMTHEYYHLPFLPIATIFIGVASERIFRSIGNLALPKRWLITAISLVVVILMLPPTLERAYKPIERFKYVVETGRAVQRLTASDDLIIGSMDAGPSLVYYSQRRGWEFEINRQNNAKELAFYGVKKAKIKDPVEELEDLRKQDAVIFASASKSQFLANNDFKNYMYDRYEVLEETENYIIFDLASPLLEK